MILSYKHYSEVDFKWFGIKHFTPKELASKGDRSLKIDLDALYKLEQARIIVDKPFIITSAYRDPLHNARVGGAPLSRHKFGDAFDISLRNQNKDYLVKVLKKVGFKGFGLSYNSFVHVDNWRVRKW